jgi:hypothetical protein
VLCLRFSQSCDKYDLLSFPNCTALQSRRPYCSLQCSQKLSIRPNAIVFGRHLHLFLRYVSRESPHLYALRIPDRNISYFRCLGLGEESVRDLRPFVAFRNMLVFTTLASHLTRKARGPPLAGRSRARHTHISSYPPYFEGAGIATGYGLDDRGVGVLSLLHVVQTGSGVHPTSYPMGTGGSFPGDKADGA